jgi:hypothetical protein
LACDDSRCAPVFLVLARRKGCRDTRKKCGESRGNNKDLKAYGKAVVLGQCSFKL